MLMAPCNGNNSVLQPNNSGKIAERKYFLRTKGKHPIEEEPAEFEEQANRIAGVSSDVEKEATTKRKRGRPAKAKPDVAVNEPTKRKSGRPPKAKPDVPVKAEPDTIPSDDVMHFSVEVERQYYLELPVNLPSTQKGLGSVIYLKDPLGRIWPLYSNDGNSNDVFPVSVLTSNWRKFCRRNQIRPGDECRFQAEKDNKCLYRVDIVRGLGF